jgi:hypothetical protein
VPKTATPYIPLADNRYAPLRNLQDDIHKPTHAQHKPQPAQSSKSSGKKQRKVLRLGESHIRGVLKN